MPRLAVLVLHFHKLLTVCLETLQIFNRRPQGLIVGLVGLKLGDELLSLLAQFLRTALRFFAVERVLMSIALKISLLPGQLTVELDVLVLERDLSLELCVKVCVLGGYLLVLFLQLDELVFNLGLLILDFLEGIERSLLNHRFLLIDDLLSLELLRQHLDLPLVRLNRFFLVI